MKLFLTRISKEDMKKEEEKNFKSREEYLEYKWLQQEEAVKKKFNIDKFDKSFYDHGSAYKQEKFNKRLAFHELLEYIFDYSNTTLKDIFWAKIKPSEDIEIYVYDYNRISRIMEYNLLFSILCDIFNIKIFSYNQSEIKQTANEDVIKKATRYVMLLMTAINSESYSESISNNTKKSTRREDKEGKRLSVTLSSKNNVWGMGFHDLKGNKLSTEQTLKLKNGIITYINFYEARHIKQYYNHIITNIKRDFKVEISKAVITRVKHSLR